MKAIKVNQAINQTSVLLCERYYHPAVGTGSFVKRFVRPFYGEAIIIKLPDGREWFAPTREFTRIDALHK